VCLADQVHAAGRARGELRAAPERALERAFGVLEQRLSIRHAAGLVRARAERGETARRPEGSNGGPLVRSTLRRIVFADHG
jgi:hypothetical protein